jgi:leader peptidase (prepilin peptidase) / N-methyltransferase
MGSPEAEPVSPPAELPRMSVLLERIAIVVAPALAAIALGRYGISGEGLLAAAFVVVLVILSVIDLRERRLPNRIVGPAVAVALAAQAILHSSRMLEWLAAAFGAALFFLLPSLVYRGGVGMGDVKLAFLLGAVLGAEVIPALMIGVVAGAVAAAVLLAVRGSDARKYPLPYGPFLSFGAVLGLLTGIASPF